MHQKYMHPGLAYVLFAKKKASDETQRFIRSPFYILILSVLQ